MSEPMINDILIFNYFGARYYNSDISVWLSVDPMSDKYPSQSPYIDVGNRPINVIDPNGEDEVELELDKLGNVVNTIETKTHDSFHVDEKDENGDYQRIANSEEYKYGTIENQHTQSTSYEDKSTNSKTIGQIDIYQIRGDDNGDEIFEFLADNTDVEWSQTKTGVAGDQGLNFLTTTHLEDKECGFRDLLQGQLQFGYTIREHTHNHPSGRAIPSGLGRTKKGKDIGAAYSIERFYSKNYPGRKQIEFNIYTSKSKTRTSYSGSSTYCDFHQCLPSVIITNK